MLSLDKPAQERIFDAAVRLFAEHGFDGVSINDIAVAAEVSKANVFHHAASKRELYEYVLHNACEVFTHGYERLVGIEGSFEQRMIALIAWHAQHLRQHPDAARLILRELTAYSQHDVVSSASRCISANLTLVQRLLEGSDAMRKVDTGFVARVLLAVSWFRFQTQPFAERMLTDKDRLDDHAFARQWADLLLHGLLREPESPRDA